MRLPMIGDDVDIEQTKQMVDCFLEQGFNYFDTAHGYLQGKSELALKECLTSRYPREDYVLNAKLSGSSFEKEEDIRPFFESQLAACGVDYFDFYLMHSQSTTNYQHYRDCRAYETAFALKAEGKVRHVGISFHDSAEMLDRILTDHYARCRFAAPPRRRNRAALFAAASLLVAGVVAALFWSADFTGSGLPSAEAYENITLVTREGSREVYDDIARISLTPKGEILIDGKENEGAETDRRTPRQEVRVHTSELVVPKGKRAHLQLSDGTRVWINSASVLRFPSAFGDTRDVFVEGEAYFEVARHAALPFRVEARGCTFTVLGTKFDISAYAEDPAVTAALLSLIHI